jgi:hypothetical protein
MLLNLVEEEEGFGKRPTVLAAATGVLPSRRTATQREKWPELEEMKWTGS